MDLCTWKASNANTSLNQDKENCDALEQEVTRHGNRLNAEEHTQPDSNLIEVEGNTDGTPPASQPTEVSTLDAATPTTKQEPDTYIEGLNNSAPEADLATLRTP